MPSIPNPHNGFIPAVDQEVKIIGACHPKSLGKVVTVTAVYEFAGEMWYDSRWFDEKFGWLSSSGVLGGVEPITKD